MVYLLSAQSLISIITQAESNTTTTTTTQKQKVKEQKSNFHFSKNTSKKSVTIIWYLSIEGKQFIKHFGLTCHSDSVE